MQSSVGFTHIKEEMSETDEDIASVDSAPNNTGNENGFGLATSTNWQRAASVLPKRGRIAKSASRAGHQVQVAVIFYVTTY